MCTGLNCCIAVRQNDGCIPDGKSEHSTYAIVVRTPTKPIKTAKKSDRGLQNSFRSFCSATSASKACIAFFFVSSCLLVRSFATPTLSLHLCAALFCSVFIHSQIIIVSTSFTCSTMVLDEKLISCQSTTYEILEKVGSGTYG